MAVLKGLVMPARIKRRNFYTTLNTRKEINIDLLVDDD